MFEETGLEDYSEVRVQILGFEETYGAQAEANLNGVSRTDFSFQCILVGWNTISPLHVNLQVANFGRC